MAGPNYGNTDYGVSSQGYKTGLVKNQQDDFQLLIPWNINCFHYIGSFHISSQV